MKMKIFVPEQRTPDEFEKYINNFIKDVDVKMMTQSESYNNDDFSLTISVWYEDKELKG